MKKRFVVTTSWDDGYPADKRIAELLEKHGATGTYYVPTRNAEGRPVLNADEVAKLSRRFEIGGHSIDHVVLTGLSVAEADRQIAANKNDLERMTGRQIEGFCYVRGRYDDQVVAAVKRAGYRYARTVESFHTTAPRDIYKVPVSIQLYPHGKSAYAKMFAKGLMSIARAKHFALAVTAQDLEHRIERLAQSAQEGGGYFHLWGHSWELEAMNLWPLLDAVLGRLAAMPGVEFLTNGQAVERYFSLNPTN